MQRATHAQSAHIIEGVRSFPVSQPPGVAMKINCAHFGGSGGVTKGFARGNLHSPVDEVCLGCKKCEIDSPSRASICS